MVLWVALGLIVVGSLSELTGLIYVAEDVTGAPGLIRRRAAARVARLYRRIRPRKPQVVSGTAHLSLPSFGVSARGHVTTPGLSLEERVAVLEAGVRRIDDGLLDVSTGLASLEGAVDAMPDSLSPAIESIADDRIKREQTDRFPVRLRSLVFLMVGVVLASSGSALSLFA